MPALQLEDAHRWWQELKMRDGNGAKALIMLTLVAARSGEVRGMTFEEIKFFSVEESEKSGFLGIWKIPAKRMKASIAHEIPIIASVKELINAQPNHNGIVFPAPRGGVLSDMTISATMKRMHHSDDKGYFDKDYGQPAVPHGLRSTFRDWAAETQHKRDIAELQLAHRIGNETEQAYNRTTLLRLRAKMLEQWHDFLEGAPLH
jgi:integrase